MKDALFDVSKEFYFDAAHQLEGGADADPRYRRLHGHSYQVEVCVRGPRTEYGWVVDMGQLERQIAAAREDLDHRLLNDVEELGPPTMENIAAFVWRRLSALPQLHRVTVRRRQNGERCEFYGPGGLPV